MPVCKNKIDIHAHISPANTYPAFGSFINCDDLIAKYDQLGVEKGLLMALISPERRSFPVLTEHVMQVAEQHPDRFMFAIGLDPRMSSYSPTADFRPILEWYKAKGAKAVGEMTANLPFDHPLYDNMLAQCAELDLPVTIHMCPGVGVSYGVVDEPGLPRLERMLKKHRNLTIFGHSQCFWAHMSACEDAETMGGYPSGKVTPGKLWSLMDECENLYCDLSAGSGYNALARDPENGFRFLEKYQDRILFGQDIAYAKDNPPLSGWLDEMYLAGNISETVYWKVCRENAVRVLKL